MTAPRPMISLGTLLVSGVLASCARVSVAPASPDSCERAGIPFYLQRPYVVIKQETAVEGEEGFLVATVKEDGLHLQAIPLDVRNCLDPLQKLGQEIRIPFEAVRLLTVPAASLFSRSAGTTDQPFGQATSGEPAKAGDPKSEQESGSRDVDTNHLTLASGDAKFDKDVPQQLDAGQFLNVLFLPDLDEKYTIDASAGLGMASLSAAMGPGSTLNKFNMQTDNRELGKWVFNSLDKVRDLALKKAGLDGATKAGTGATGEATSGRGASSNTFVGRHSVIVKYIYVGYATPGAYPILKDKEYRCAEGGSCVPEDPYLVKAVWPYTRYAFRVRRELSLWVDDEAPRSGGTAPPSASALTDVVAALNAASGQAIAGTSYTLGNAVASNASGTVEVSVVGENVTGAAAAQLDSGIRGQFLKNVRGQAGVLLAFRNAAAPGGGNR